MMQAQWQERVDLLTKWDQPNIAVDGVTFDKKTFHQDNRKGYKWVKYFSINNNHFRVTKLYRVENGVRCQATHTRNIFTIMKEAHFDDLCHLKSDCIWQDIHNGYYNIPRKLIKYSAYPICLGDNPKVKLAHGVQLRNLICVISLKIHKSWPGDETQTEYN